MEVRGLLYSKSARTNRYAAGRQREMLGRLAQEHPEAVVQTHLSETEAECAWVAELFPGCADYTAVYERYGLVRPRSVFGHGIHLSAHELDRLGRAGASIAHCPTSNLFLGSGMFRLRESLAAHPGLRIGLGSDVGAGTSLSPLVTAGEAYKVSRMRGLPLSAAEALWFATLGGAHALGVGDRVGSLEPGKDADVVVLDPAASPVLARRADMADDIEELLFALMMLGDDRAIHATWAAGRPAMAPVGSF